MRSIPPKPKPKLLPEARIIIAKSEKAPKITEKVDIGCFCSLQDATAASPPNTYAINEKITWKEKVEGASVNIPTPIAPTYASPSRIEKRFSL